MTQEPTGMPSADEHEVLRKLADRYWNRLYKLAYMFLHDTAGAEDAAQEVFTRAIGRVREFAQPGADFFMWGCQVVVNFCRSRIRDARSRETTVEQETLDEARPMHRRPGPATAAVLQETYRRAATALAGLDPLHREAFVLHYVEGFPFRTIANVCGITEEAVRTRAHRARQALSQELASMLDPEVRRRLEAESPEPTPAPTPVRGRRKP